MLDKISDQLLSMRNAELDKVNRMDEERQRSLIMMKAQFMNVSRDLIPGYREALIGEKTKGYDDDPKSKEQNDQSPEKVRQRIVRATSRLVSMEDPSQICYRNTAEVEDQVAQIENQLQNHYLKRISSIWRNDAQKERGRQALKERFNQGTMKNNSSFKPNDQKSRRQLSVENSNNPPGMNAAQLASLQALGTEQLPTNPTFLGQSISDLNATSGLSLNPDLIERAQARYPIVFKQKRASEISEQNLMILHHSQAVIDENTRLKSQNHESTVASALHAVQSSYLQQLGQQERGRALGLESSGPLSPDHSATRDGSQRRFASDYQPREILKHSQTERPMADQAKVNKVDTVQGRLEQLKNNLCNIDLESKMNSSRQFAHPRYQSGSRIKPGLNQVEDQTEALKMSILQDLKEVNESQSLHRQPIQERSHQQLPQVPYDQLGGPRLLAAAQMSLGTHETLIMRNSQERTPVQSRRLPEIQGGSQSAEQFEESDPNVVTPGGSITQNPGQRDEEEGKLELNISPLASNNKLSRSTLPKGPGTSVRISPGGGQPEQNVEEQVNQTKPKQETRGTQRDDGEHNKSSLTQNEEHTKELTKEQKQGQEEHGEQSQAKPSEGRNTPMQDAGAGGQYLSTDGMHQKTPNQLDFQHDLQGESPTFRNIPESHAETAIFPPETIADQEFEESFNNLINRLNSHLKSNHKESAQLLTSFANQDQKMSEEEALRYQFNSKRDAQFLSGLEDSGRPPYRSSHIGHLQVFRSHREDVAAVLRKLEPGFVASAKLCKEANKSFAEAQSPEYRQALLDKHRLKPSTSQQDNRDIQEQQQIQQLLQVRQLNSPSGATEASKLHSVPEDHTPISSEQAQLSPRSGQKSSLTMKINFGIAKNRENHLKIQKYLYEFKKLQDPTKIITKLGDNLPQQSVGQNGQNSPFGPFTHLIGQQRTYLDIYGNQIQGTFILDASGKPVFLPALQDPSLRTLQDAQSLGQTTSQGIVDGAMIKSGDQQAFSIPIQDGMGSPLSLQPSRRNQITFTSAEKHKQLQASGSLTRAARGSRTKDDAEIDCNATDEKEQIQHFLRDTGVSKENLEVAEQISEESAEPNQSEKAIGARLGTPSTNMKDAQASVHQPSPDAEQQVKQAAEEQDANKDQSPEKPDLARQGNTFQPLNMDKTNPQLPNIRSHHSLQSGRYQETPHEDGPSRHPKAFPASKSKKLLALAASHPGSHMSGGTGTISPSTRPNRFDPNVIQKLIKSKKSSGGSSSSIEAAAAARGGGPFAPVPSGRRTPGKQASGKKAQGSEVGSSNPKKDGDQGRNAPGPLKEWTQQHIETNADLADVGTPEGGVPDSGTLKIVEETVAGKTLHDIPIVLQGQAHSSFQSQLRAEKNTPKLPDNIVSPPTLSHNPSDNLYPRFQIGMISPAAINNQLPSSIPPKRSKNNISKTFNNLNYLADPLIQNTSKTLLDQHTREGDQSTRNSNPSPSQETKRIVRLPVFTSKNNQPIHQNENTFKFQASISKWQQNENNYKTGFPETMSQKSSIIVTSVGNDHFSTLASKQVAGPPQKAFEHSKQLVGRKKNAHSSSRKIYLNAIKEKEALEKQQKLAQQKQLRLKIKEQRDRQRRGQTMDHGVVKTMLTLEQVVEEDNYTRANLLRNVNSSSILFTQVGNSADISQDKNLSSQIEIGGIIIDSATRKEQLQSATLENNVRTSRNHQAVQRSSMQSADVASEPLENQTLITGPATYFPPHNRRLDSNLNEFAMASPGDSSNKLALLTKTTLKQNTQKQPFSTILVENSGQQLNTSLDVELPEEGPGQTPSRQWIQKDISPSSTQIKQLDYFTNHKKLPSSNRNAARAGAGGAPYGLKVQLGGRKQTLAYLKRTGSVPPPIQEDYVQSNKIHLNQSKMGVLFKELYGHMDGSNMREKETQKEQSIGPSTFKLSQNDSKLQQENKPAIQNEIIKNIFEKGQVERLVKYQQPSMMRIDQGLSCGPTPLRQDMLSTSNKMFSMMDKI